MYSATSNGESWALKERIYESLTPSKHELDNQRTAQTSGLNVASVHVFIAMENKE